MGGFIDFFRGPWYIAVYTYREGIRKKTLIGFLILSLLVIFGALTLLGLDLMRTRLRPVRARRHPSRTDNKA